MGLSKGVRPEMVTERAGELHITVRPPEERTWNVNRRKEPNEGHQWLLSPRHLISVLDGGK